MSEQTTASAPPTLHEIVASTIAEFNLDRIKTTNGLSESQQTMLGIAIRAAMMATLEHMVEGTGLSTGDAVMMNNASFRRSVDSAVRFGLEFFESGYSVGSIEEVLVYVALYRSGGVQKEAAARLGWNPRIINYYLRLRGGCREFMRSRARIGELLKLSGPDSV